MQNYFELLGIPMSCDVDEKLLAQNYREQQSRLHPDQFVNADADRRLLAVQQSSMLNDAHDTLKTPLRRAEHLLLLHGIDASVHVQADMDAAFLLSQLALREQLEALSAAGDLAGLEQLRQQCTGVMEATWQEFSVCVHSSNYQAGKTIFHKLQFLNKLLDEILEAESRLLDY